MNLSKLFETQKRLDKRIVEEKGLEGQDLLDKKILAFQVELGELANEWRGFKFWSKDQKARTYEKCHVCQGHGETMVPAFPSFDEFEQELCPVCEGEGTTGKNPLLEEYVDCLHFILSIGLEIGYYETFTLNPLIYPMKGNRTNGLIVEKFNDCFHLAYMMSEDNYFNELVQYFFDLGYLLGFTWNEIEQAYFEKNEINHKRQEGGY